jgi:tRNA threonylcarbamoyladenosine biosynthesis protein TsaB
MVHPEEKTNFILALETATEVCSVAVSKNGVCFAEKNISKPNAHGSILTVFIEDILKENDLHVNDLSAIAYSSGPGSYTGLRIGLSVAKGICYGAELPLIAITTLEHMASNFPEEYCFPMIDARRMEVYGALIQNGRFIIEPFACIVDEYKWDEILFNNQVRFIGNGAPKSKQILQKFQNAIFEDDYLVSARSLSEMAYTKLIRNEFVDLAYSVPFYLKEANVTVAKKKGL